MPFATSKPCPPVAPPDSGALYRPPAVEAKLSISDVGVPVLSSFAVYAFCWPPFQEPGTGSGRSADTPGVKAAEPGRHPRGNLFARGVNAVSRRCANSLFGLRGFGSAQFLMLSKNR